jgi:hypothetical protein
MSCDFYEQHELGKLEKKEFQEHMKECRICQEAVLQDNLLMQDAKKLKVSVHAPLLWNRIHQDLQNEKTGAAKVQPLKIKVGRSMVLKIAASILIAIIISGYFVLQTTSKSSPLLTENKLKEVEKLEESYEQAITELEEIVKPKMASINIELVLNYKDRLETIDEQIKLCKEELKLNPANTHLRRYLLAALMDKKQTLIEIQKLNSGETLL